MMKRNFTIKMLPLMLCTLAGIVLIACKNTNWLEETTKPVISKSVANIDEYLYFASGYDGVDELTITEADNEVILKAVSRVEIVEKKGFYSIKAPEASEINMSPEVLTAVKQIAVRSNLNMTRALLNKNYIPRTRQASEGDDTIYTPWDCVPQCIGSIANIFGLNRDTYYSSAISYMDKQAWSGSGVPLSGVGSLLGSMFGSGNVSQKGNRDYLSWGNGASKDSVTTIGINTSIGGHQVIYRGMTTDNRTVLYSDSQNDEVVNFTNIRNVNNAYTITK